MNFQKRANILLGLGLIFFGGWFLAQQLFPEFYLWDYLDFSWPWYVIGAGGLLLLLALLLGAPGLAVPATIVAGIGGILYWQNATGNWQSWSYIWTLIPGFVGIGIILAELLSGNLRKGVRSGGSLLIISAILFVVFGAFLGWPGVFGDYWPVLLILIGIWFLIQPLVNRRTERA